MPADNHVDAQDILTELLIVLEQHKRFADEFTAYTGYNTKTVEDALNELEVRNWE